MATATASANGTRMMRRAAQMVVGAIVTTIVLPGFIVLLAHQLVRKGPHQQTTKPREVTPIRCHSHNDYWREVPLISALEAGCIGVEADVWAYQNDLFVGHTQGALSPNRTLRALYVEPLVQVLQEKNRGSVIPGKPSRGLYDSDTTQTVVLLVDIKENPERAWWPLVESLEPLRQKGWLSSLEDDKVSMAAVTVVITGEIPAQALESGNGSMAQNIFLDAPLSKLGNNRHHSPKSYWASGSFTKTIGRVWTGGLRPGQLSKIRKHVNEAHSRGLQVRFWNPPAWPIALRDHIWDTLVKEGVDIIDADDLQGVAAAWRRLGPV